MFVRSFPMSRKNAISLVAFLGFRQVAEQLPGVPAQAARQAGQPENAHSGRQRVRQTAAYSGGRRFRGGGFEIGVVRDIGRYWKGGWSMSMLVLYLG